MEDYITTLQKYKIENLEKQNKEKSEEIKRLQKEIERLTKILKKVS